MLGFGAFQRSDYFGLRGLGLGAWRSGFGSTTV